MSKNFVEEYIFGMFEVDGQHTARKVASLLATYVMFAMLLDSTGIESEILYGVPAIIILATIIGHGITMGSGGEGIR